jgi:hypothetical protein
MVESKSAYPPNDFNGHSEKIVGFSLKGINRLSGDSERYCAIGNFITHSNHPARRRTFATQLHRANCRSPDHRLEG